MGEGEGVGGQGHIPSIVYCSMYFFMLIVLFYVLFVCKCVQYYCHRVSTQLQLTNISISVTADYVVLCIVCV
jgi:hypothetical protein